MFEHKLLPGVPVAAYRELGKEGMVVEYITVLGRVVG